MAGAREARYRAKRFGELQCDPVRATGREDACERTHANVRARGRGGTVVHRQHPQIRTEVALLYATACGFWIPKDEAVRTADRVTCRNKGCAPQKRERPAPG